MKRRRSARLKEKRQVEKYGKKRKRANEKSLATPPSKTIPPLPLEMYYDIFSRIEHSKRGSIACICKYWNAEIEKIPVLNHPKDYKDRVWCTCPQCFEKGLHMSHENGDKYQCVCPTCFGTETVKKLQTRLKNMLKDVISRYPPWLKRRRFSKRQLKRYLHRIENPLEFSDTPSDDSHSQTVLKYEILIELENKINYFH